MNEWETGLSIAASITTLLGVAYGLYEYLSFKCVRNRKMADLVAYLKNAKQSASGGKAGQHTAAHLTRHVGLTEDEILQLSFVSKNIARKVTVNDDGKAETMLFEYVD